MTMAVYIRRPSSQSELTPIMFSMEVTYLVWRASYIMHINLLYYLNTIKFPKILNQNLLSYEMQNIRDKYT